MSSRQSQIHRSTVPPRSTHATYHPGGYGVSEGLKRARRPYLIPNFITGGLILTFATSVYFYSIAKVKQDDFSDLDDLRATGSSISSTLPSSNPAPAVSAPAPIGGAVPSTSTSTIGGTSSTSTPSLFSSLTSRLPSFFGKSSGSNGSAAGATPSPDVQPARGVKADAASAAHEKTRADILSRQGRLV